MSPVATGTTVAGDESRETRRDEEGGIGKVYQVFGDEFNRLLDELNEALAA